MINANVDVVNEGEDSNLAVSSSLALNRIIDSTYQKCINVRRKEQCVGHRMAHSLIRSTLFDA